MLRKLILVVEDDPKTRRLFRDVLDYEGFDSAAAAAGDDGVRMAKQLRPALILMDIQLPRLDGIAALGRLREDPATRGIPVVAVTASAMAQDRPQLERAGFDGCQYKPVDVDEFVTLVRSLVA